MYVFLLFVFQTNSISRATLTSIDSFFYLLFSLLSLSQLSHPNALAQAHLALYCFASSQVTVALKLLYRARYLLILVCGELHPEMAVLDVS